MACFGELKAAAGSIVNVTSIAGSRVPVCWQQLYDFHGGASRLHQAGSRLRADPRAPRHQSHHASGRADDHQSIRSLRARGRAGIARSVWRRNHVLTIGPMSAEGSLRYPRALTFGADRAVLLTDRRFAGSDTLVITYALAAAIRKVGKSMDRRLHLYRQANHRR